MYSAIGSDESLSAILAVASLSIAQLCCLCLKHSTSLLSIDFALNLLSTFRMPCHDCSYRQPFGGWEGPNQPNGVESALRLHHAGPGRLYLEHHHFVADDKSLYTCISGMLESSCTALCAGDLVGCSLLQKRIPVPTGQHTYLIDQGAASSVAFGRYVVAEVAFFLCP